MVVVVVVVVVAVVVVIVVVVVPREPTTYEIVGSKMKARLFTQCCSKPRLLTKKPGF